MIFVNHRVNDSSNISANPAQNGCEIDIRYHNNQLVLWHDPFHHPELNPELFENWLAVYAAHSNGAGPLILNVKTEGIEDECIEMMRRFDITNYFFLDLSMPYFVKYARLAQAKQIDGFTSKNLAVRYSEFEPIEYALAFAGMAKWVWVDCFTHLPLSREILDKFTGFRLCLVSPELQGHDFSKINDFIHQLNGLNYTPAAVCTKRPDLWKGLS